MAAREPDRARFGVESVKSKDHDPITGASWAPGYNTPQTTTGRVLWTLRSALVALKVVSEHAISGKALMEFLGPNVEASRSNRGAQEPPYLRPEIAR
jgi:hypothetical protein